MTIQNSYIKLKRRPFLNSYEQNEATPVDVTIFIQSLCPGSALFLSQQMAPTYENLGSNLINIDIITYGLANVSKCFC